MCQHRFIVDCMLGTLAKRLRSYGFDTLYFQRIEDSELVEIACNDGRIILTRDRRLLKRKKAKQSVLIETDDLEQQVCTVLSELEIDGLRNEGFLSRCLGCNHELEPKIKKDVIGKVPPFVFLTHSRFAYCRTCDKYYWRGTHYQNMQGDDIH